MSGLILWIVGSMLLATGLTGLAYLCVSESMQSAERDHAIHWTWVAGLLAFGSMFAMTSCMFGSRMFIF